MKKRMIITITLALLLVGCILEKNAIEPIATNMVTITPSREIGITTPTAEDFLEGMNTNNIDVKTPGRFVLMDLKRNNKLFLFDYKTNKIYDIQIDPSYTITSYAVSPNKEYFVFLYKNSMDFKDGKITIINSQGLIINDFSVDGELWFGIDCWLNNENILIDKRRSLPDISLATPLPTMIYNIKTDTLIDLHYDLPDLVDLYPELLWINYGFSATGYDNSLSYVVYASSKSQYILWDLIHSKEIVELPMPVGHGSDGPVWDVDGEKILIDILVDDLHGEELVLVDSNGNYKKITNFTSKYTGVSIRNYQWSPDKKKVAFVWLSNQTTSVGWQLAVVDIDTSLVDDYGLVADQLPIWSLDNNYLLISNIKIKPYKNEYTTYIVDLHKATYTILGENIQGLGWLFDE